jgi:hypothetical protein
VCVWGGGWGVGCGCGGWRVEGVEGWDGVGEGEREGWEKGGRGTGREGGGGGSCYTLLRSDTPHKLCKLHKLHILHTIYYILHKLYWNSLTFVDEIDMASHFRQLPLQTDHLPCHPCQSIIV